MRRCVLSPRLSFLRARLRPRPLIVPVSLRMGISMSRVRARRPADGKMPATFEAQAQQTLDNVKAVVEAAGLTLDNVVYTHAYLEDIGQ